MAPFVISYYYSKTSGKKQGRMAKNGKVLLRTKNIVLYTFWLYDRMERKMGGMPYGKKQMV